MPSKLWKLYSEAHSYCSAASCVSGSLLNHLQQFHGGLFRFDTLHAKYNTGKPVCQQKQRRGWLGSFICYVFNLSPFTVRLLQPGLFSNQDHPNKFFANWLIVFVCWNNKDRLVSNYALLILNKRSKSRFRGIIWILFCFIPLNLDFAPLFGSSRA